MTLYCDQNFGYDSYINIGDYNAEVNLAYTPKPAMAVSQQGQQNPQPPKPAPKPAPKPEPKPEPKPAPKPEPKPAPKPVAKIHINPPPQNKNQLPKVDGPTKNNHNGAQYIDKANNGMPYMCVKLSETEFAWSNQDPYWRKEKHPQALMGKPIFHLNKVFYIDPKAHFFDVPKANYFLLFRHNPVKSAGLSTCLLTVKVDGQEVYKKDFFNKQYKKLRIKTNLMDEFVMNISEKSFNNSNNHEIIVTINGQDTVKKNWDIDGFILIPDNCDGKIESIYNQYFNVGFQRL
jgi:VCBS repeat-containing protein